MDLFHNRRDAGQQLAAQLSAYANRDDVVVLGLPRGGVPVAFQELVDEVVCAMTPQPFYGVGAWYDDFSQTTD